MRVYALDTNCFIDAVRPASASYHSLQRVLDSAKRGEVCLKVSLHTLHELEKKKDEAWLLAKTLPELPHWPIGSWDEQVGNWRQQVGTWDDIRQSDQVQLELSRLAKSGADIRDRGGYLDALRSGLDGFVTSDKKLVSPGPAERINARFPTKVLTPEQLAKELGTDHSAGIAPHS